MIRNALILLMIVPVMGIAGVAAAGPDDTPSAAISAPALDVDVEIDPIAYALSGHSLHAGLRWNRFRLDLGAFALEVPEAVHGTDGVAVYGSGFGAKLDYYPLHAAPGLFVGAQLSRFRESATHTGTAESASTTHTTVGARIGYRIAVASGFYLLPWVGVDVSLSDRAQTVGGATYDPGRVMFFPTVHLGKRF